ncbi:MAG: WXG100 family type VII secretion target [Clostridia bacterium]
MDTIKVNTDAVIATATTINSLNAKIESNISAVESAMNALNNNWDGAASTVAITKFNTLKSEYHSSRFDVVSNYTNFLLQQVGEGYVTTEDTNKSLAEAFK